MVLKLVRIGQIKLFSPLHHYDVLNGRKTAKKQLS